MQTNHRSESALRKQRGVHADRPRLAPASRSCARCERLKPLEDFNIDKRHGRSRSWCKACRAEANREWKQRNRAAYLEGKRRYRESLKAREAA